MIRIKRNVWRSTVFRQGMSFSVVEKQTLKQKKIECAKCGFSLVDYESGQYAHIFAVSFSCIVDQAHHF